MPKVNWDRILGAAPASEPAPPRRTVDWDRVLAPDAGAQASALPPEPDLEAAQERKNALDTRSARKMAISNILDARRGLGDARRAGDQTEVAKASEDFMQARNDRSRLVGGTPPPEHETPVIGNGSGFERLGNALGAFMSPESATLQTVAQIGKAKPGEPFGASDPGYEHRDGNGFFGKGPVGYFINTLGRHFLSPAARGTLGEQTRAMVKAQGHEEEPGVSWLDYLKDAFRKTQARRGAATATLNEAGYPQDPFGIGPDPWQRNPRATPPEVQESANRAAAEADKATPETLPHRRYALGPVGEDTAAVASEILPMVVKTPGVRLMEGGMGLVGKGITAGARVAGKAIDSTAGGRALLDAFSEGGALRRAPESFGPVKDELLEATVAKQGRRGELAQQFLDHFQGLSPAERTHAIDAVEYPGLLTADPATLAKLQTQGIDITPYLTKPRTEVMRASEFLEKAHPEARQALQSVDPSVKMVDRPYVTHLASSEAERALEKRGVNVAGLQDADARAAATKAAGLGPRPELGASSQKSRSLADALNEQIKAKGMERPPVEDTRLSVNRFMDQEHPGVFTHRPYFSGEVLPQAAKIDRDIVDAENLKLLQKWAARGKDVTDPLTGEVAKGALAAAPGGAGSYSVPSNPAWARVTGGKKIAVPTPVAEFIDKPKNLGQGFFDEVVSRLGGTKRVGASKLSPVTEAFKVPATIMRPGYYVRNKVTNLGQTALEFGSMPGMPSYQEAARLKDALLAGDRATVVTAKNGATTTLGEIADKLRARGNLGLPGGGKVPIGPGIESKLAEVDRGSTKDAIRRFLTPSKNPIVQKAANTFGTKVEEGDKTLAAILGFKETGDVTAGVKRAEDILFNHNRSPEVLGAASKAFPFVGWWGKNLGLQAKQLVRNPSRVYNFQRAQEATRQAFLSEKQRKESLRRPEGKFVTQAPRLYTGVEDRVGQPIVAGQPFNPEGEAYDFIGGALPAVTGQGRVAAHNVEQALASRALPGLVRTASSGTNWDVLRDQPMGTPVYDKNGNLLRYEEGTQRAGAVSEAVHRFMEKHGMVKPGEQLPVLATSRSKTSPYVQQDASRKRTLEQIPTPFPLSLAGLGSQNSTLPAWAKLVNQLGAGVQPVQYSRNELSRAFQTKEQIAEQRRTTAQKAGRRR